MSALSLSETRVMERGPRGLLIERGKKAMRESTVRDAFEQLVQAFTGNRSTDRTKTPRLPRALRPHAARSTYRPVTDIEVIRHMTT